MTREYAYPGDYLLRLICTASGYTLYLSQLLENVPIDFLAYNWPTTFEFQRWPLHISRWMLFLGFFNDDVFHIIGTLHYNIVLCICLYCGVCVWGRLWDQWPVRYTCTCTCKARHILRRWLCLLLGLGLLEQAMGWLLLRFLGLVVEDKPTEFSCIAVVLENDLECHPIAPHYGGTLVVSRGTPPSFLTNSLRSLCTPLVNRAIMCTNTIQGCS